MNTAPTWIKNPQPPEDAFEAERWFADPKLFRYVSYDPISQVWRGPAARLDALGLVTDNG
jgi:hypothetical protein